MTKRRTKKLTQQFADAIDIIVRGVKSGLPLTECLRIIAKESPAPLGDEFQLLTDSVAMGTNIETALQKFYHAGSAARSELLCYRAVDPGESGR